MSIIKSIFLSVAVLIAIWVCASFGGLGILIPLTFAIVFIPIYGIFRLIEEIKYLKKQMYFLESKLDEK